MRVIISQTGMSKLMHFKPNQTMYNIPFFLEKNTRKLYKMEDLSYQKEPQFGKQFFSAILEAH